MPEEPLLQAHTIVRIEMRPVLEPMHLEPFLPRGRAHEALVIAAGMQALPAPARRRQERRRDRRPVGRTRAVIGVVERMRQDLGAEIGAARRELRLAQALRPADELAGDGAPRATLAKPMLHGL